MYVPNVIVRESMAAATLHKINATGFSSRYPASNPRPNIEQRTVRARYVEPVENGPRKNELMIENPATQRTSVNEMFSALYERKITINEIATTREEPAREKIAIRGVTVDDERRLIPRLSLLWRIASASVRFVSPEKNAANVVAIEANKTRYG